MKSSIVESFQDITELLTTSFNLDDLLQIILKSLRDNFSVEAAAFWMLDEKQPGNKDERIFRASSAFGVDLEQLNTNCENRSHDFLWYQSTINSRKSLLLSSDYGREPIGVFKQYSEYSAIASPIFINDEPIGLLVLTHPKHNQYSVDTLPIIKTFTNYASIAIQKARLINTSEEQSWISNVMQQISEAAQLHENLDDQLEAITRIIPLMIDVNKCAVFLRGRSNNEYVFNAQFGYDKVDEPKVAMLPFTEEGHMAIQSLEDGESYIKISSSFLYNHGGKIEEKSPNCCLLLSLYAHENIYGVLLIDISEEISEKKVSRFPKTNALLSISQQIALSIENFRLKEARDFETYTTIVLLQSAEAIVLAASLKEALENICNLLPFFIGVDTTIIYLINQQQKTYHLNAYHSINWKIQTKNLPGQFREGAYPGLDLILREKNPAIFRIEEIPPEDWLKINEKFIFTRLDDYSVSTPLLMVFPLQIQGEVFGVLIVRESEGGFENREKKIEIINGIARQISVAVQNEQLKSEIIDRERMRREFQFAQEIQRTFLPEPEQEIHGCEIQTIWRPALQLGGDFYDAFPLNNNKYGFVVADVSDKGIPAALYMTVARTLIHAAAKEGDGPSVTLERVNRLLIENSQEGLFITAIYGVMDLSTGSFIYSNAGHNKPLWLRKKQKEVRWLEKGGMPLGVMEKINIKDHQIEMAVGDEIVMYTDGVTEGKSKEGKFFGEERLYNVLNAYKKNSSRRLVDLIDEKLLKFQGSEAPSDDVTILIIKRVN